MVRVDGHHRLGQPLRDLGDFQANDRELFVGGREVDEEVEAPALEAVGELARVVGGEHHQGDLGGPDRAELRHRNLEVGQDLQEKRFEFRLRLVDLVDQQHHRVHRLDRLQERARGEEAMGEERVVLARDPRHRVGQRRGVRDQLADTLAQQLGVEELLGVFPLVERLALVESLVALQADEMPRGHFGQGLGQLGLAHPGRPLDEHRPAHALGQEHHGGDPAIGDVAGVLELLLDVLDGLKHGGSLVVNWRTV